MTIEEVIVEAKKRIGREGELDDDLAQWIVDTLTGKRPRGFDIQFGFGVVEIVNDVSGAYSPAEARAVAKDLLHYADEASKEPT